MSDSLTMRPPSWPWPPDPLVPIEYLRDHLKNDNENESKNNSLDIFHVQYWKLIQYDRRTLFTLKCPFFLLTDDLFFGTVADSCVLLLGAAGRTHGRKGVWRCSLARSGVRYHPGDVTCHDS